MITFIAWSPDDTAIQVCDWMSRIISVLTIMQSKMIYASSKDALKRSLPGIAEEYQANDEDELEYEHILQKVSKGKA